MTDLDLGIKMFLQIAVILLACRIVGYLGKRFLGQPQVVSEMIAGVILGPSLFAILAPEWQNWLFPQNLTLASGEVVRHPSMQIIYAMSQVGLALYMFVVGLDFSHEHLQSRTKSAVTVSVAGIVAPLILGALLSTQLHGPEFFGAVVTPAKAALFMGAAMCITAFPMLARIIFERGLTNTSMGNLALAAAASDDAIAWGMLAIVLAAAKGDNMIAIKALGGGALFALFSLFVGRRLYAKLGTWTDREGSVTPSIFLTTIVIVMIASWFTDAIGIYAVFGAFLTGVTMPRGQFASEVKVRIESLTTSLLLPLFFVFSGLNTKITLINTPTLWGIAIVITVVAILAKGIACALAARAVGEPWRDAWAIGTLMNSRGLMELIILNFGLQAGVITPTLFSMMVVMAIVTTLMATPVFKRIYHNQVPAADGVPA